MIKSPRGDGSLDEIISVFFTSPRLAFFRSTPVAAFPNLNVLKDAGPRGPKISISPRSCGVFSDPPLGVGARRPQKKGFHQEASLMTADSCATSLRGLRRLLDQLKDPQQEVV